MLLWEPAAASDIASSTGFFRRELHGSSYSRGRFPHWSEHKMLRAFCTLLICQMIGETLSHGLHLPVPGPLIGMLILLAWFIYRGGPSTELANFSTKLLSWLAMLFVPAATGIITGFDVLKADWWRIGIAILISTSVGLAVTAWTMNRLIGATPK